MKKILIILVVILIFTAAITGIILWRKGKNKINAWTCENGVWIKQGNPALPRPLEPCLQDTSSGPVEEKNNNPRLIGGDKDEHGCLIAAGYSWCESKQKCLRSWEEICPPN